MVTVDCIECDGTIESSEVNQVWTTQVSKASICSARENEESISSNMDNKQIDSTCEQINLRENDDDQDKQKRTALPFKRTRCPPQKRDKDFLR